MIHRLPVVIYEAMPSRVQTDLWVLSYANDALLTVTGYPTEDFVGEYPERHLFALIHPDDRVRVGVEYDRCRTTLSMVSLRYRLLHATDGYRLVEERSIFERDPDGRLHSYGCLIDSNAPERQQEYLADLDTRLARLNADVAIATGQEFLEHLCRRLSHLTGARQVGIFRVEHERYLECLAIVRDGLLLPRYGIPVAQSIFKPLGAQDSLELYLDSKDQTWTMLEHIHHVTAIRLNNRQHEWLGVLALGHDHPIERDRTLDRVLELYSDRAVTEIERLGLEDRLQESESRYRAFFETAVQASVVVNVQGRILDLNRAAQQLFGLISETYDARIELQDIFPRQQPDGRSSLYHFLHYIRHSIQGPVPPERWHIHRLDGEARIVTVYAVSTVLNLSERVLLTFEDITDQVRAEQELRTQHALQNERQGRLRNLVALATELERQPSLGDFLYEACRQLYRQSGIHEAAFFEREQDRWHSMANPAPTGAPQQHRGAVARALRSGQSDWRRDTGHWLYFPLLGRDAPLAVLVLGCSQPVYDDQEFVSLLMQTISLSFDNLLQRHTLRQQAMRDSLTDLGNRAQLHEWIRESLAQDPRQTASLLLFDLNRFKEINDSLGHHFGDRLLCEIGPRVRLALDRDNNWGICRLGGDEFAVFLPRIRSEKACRLAEDISEHLRRPYVIDALQLQVEASIGIAHYPDQGNDGHELLRCADVAMYAAKHAGRSLVEFESALDANTPQRIAVLSELDQGLREGHLWVAYQPVISASDGRTKGFEALVRWQHPELGALSPAEFIPIAEMGQGIHRITEFVLHTGLAALANWRRRVPDLYIAVNLSSRVLLDQNLPRNIERLLREHGLPGTALVLELTESTLLSDPLRAVDIINELAAIGIQVEVDDFGTGYSSLAYLKSLPIQALKVDKSFVADLLLDPHDRIIVESTIKMAHNLDLATIAEGVEDEATLIELVKMGCDAIQGYYFSKPLPPADVDVWLKRYE
ncbi:EAL domain-containing protein [Saccharospirillum salsuginis]|nr:EAL domain-containing protein [Saccharospirillum salsuginis]